MFYAYCLKSLSHPGFRYIGFTSDLKQRIHDHNHGCNPSTAWFTPLHLAGYIAFPDKSRAQDFERYLKSGSGHAFATKRLW